ncbi:MAG: hypothetical protein AW10_02067 [Candidatus Accumulibacter appositus]|uniref:Uncharacterized protein n=1 Tax=Candidatus Accumulibacter appositus TaxID=1454003 RepID=A0A011PSF9_9PROT|nr:MAG: hypothetical protein AW10_02067 [Candidatus Accumulibacter appositus]
MTSSLAAGAPADQFPDSLQSSEAAAPVQMTPAGAAAVLPMSNWLGAAALPMMTWPPLVQMIVGSMTLTDTLGAPAFPALPMNDGSQVSA